MAYSYPEIKSFSGLHLQANSFTVPDGALEAASNCVIQKDNIITKRRGFYQYFSPGSGTLNALFNFQSRLVQIYNNKASYYTDTGSSPNLTATETNLTGETVAVTGSRVSRGTQSNNNFYFTSDNGVMKLENFNSAVSKAGTPPALDLRAVLKPENGALNGDSQIAYRVVLGKRDINDNLLLGAPSEFLGLTNPLRTLKSYTSSGAGPYTVTVTDSGHNLSVGMAITVSSATDTDANGTQIITVAGATTFQFSVAADPTSGTLSWTSTRKPRLELSIPSEITSTSQNYFFRIYRTGQVSANVAAPLGDFKLVDERKITSAEMASLVAYYEDDIDDVLVINGPELYTNENSQEGEVNANDRAPICEDITLYKNHLIHGNCRTRHAVDLSVVDTSKLSNGDTLQVKVDATTRTYVAAIGVGNSTVRQESVSGTGTVTIGYVAHGFSDGWQVYVSGVTGTVPEGLYTVSGATANTFNITSGGNSATDLYFQGISNGTNPIFQLSSATFPADIRNTARGIVKAVNRDSSSLVYAKYISGLTDTPGELRFQAKGFTGVIYLKASSTTSGQGYFPVLPDSFASGDQVYSRNDTLPHVFFSSKVGEPEAVPILSFYPAGARNRAMIRCVALRDSIILLKEDGVWRVTGDDRSNFTITALDTTVICVASNSVQVLNNQVIFLSNQGVCLVTENSVQIISRKIENVIQPILGSSSLVANTGAIAYESERLYLLSTIQPNNSNNSIVYAYNVLNDTWTTWDTTFRHGVLGAGDILYLITTANKVAKERKNQDKTDYCGQNYPISVVSVATNKLSAILSTGSAVPEVGDILVMTGVISRINTVSASGANYMVTFILQTNLIAADSPILYSRYTSQIKLAPFHAGLIGRMKQFAQMQIHFRDSSINRLTISFQGNEFGGSEATTWLSRLISGGWGLAPWGFFSWGQEEGINILTATTPAPIVRIYVSRFHQRNTFIQPVIEHAEAGEPFSLQSISFAMRGYGERVSR